jgi:hypothetical protein
MFNCNESSLDRMREAQPRREWRERKVYGGFLSMKPGEEGTISEAAVTEVKSPCSAARGGHCPHRSTVSPSQRHLACTKAILELAAGESPFRTLSLFTDDVT